MNDWLALHVARNLYRGTQTRFAETPWDGERARTTLLDQGLLCLIDPTDPSLPLDATGRELIAASSRLHSIRALQRVGVLTQIRDALADAGVPAIFFKGVVLSQVIWERLSARGAGDIDVFVPASALPDAVQALRTIGIRVPAALADLRPRSVDRQLHHALSLDLRGVEVDVHYRLDSLPSVLPLTFDQAWESTQTVVLAGQQITTFDDELTVLVLAAGGGRDRWNKWGRLLDFAVLDRRVTVPDERARDLGLGDRLSVARTLVGLLDPTGNAPASAQATSLARQVVAQHARGRRSGFVGIRVDAWQADDWRLRSAGRRVDRHRLLRRFVAIEDAPARPPDAGLRVEADLVLSKALGLREVEMQPPHHLCDLVDGIVEGRLDGAAFQELDRTLRADSQTAEEMAVMPALAPLVPSDHWFAGRMIGLRRQARVQVAAAEVLVAAVPGEGLLFGDLACARRFYREPADRRVRTSHLAMPLLTRQQIWQLSREMADSSGARLTGRRWPILQRHGQQLVLHRGMASGFDTARLRQRLDGSAEELLYDTLVRCGLGSPRILWYADAVAAGPDLDWDRLWSIARDMGWAEPVLQASAVLRARGWDVPLHPSADRWLDRVYWSGPDVTAIRRSALGLRLLRR